MLTRELWESVLPVWYFATPTEHPLAPLDQSMDASIRPPEIFGNRAPSKNERYRHIQRLKGFETSQQEAADSTIRFRENALEESKAKAPTLSKAVALARDTSRALKSSDKYLRDPENSLELQPRTGIHIYGSSVALLNPSETPGQDQDQDHDQGQGQGRGRGRGRDQDQVPGRGPSQGRGRGPSQDRGSGPSQGRGGLRGRGGYASRGDQVGRGE